MVFPILPANTLSGGYDIDNSLRFNSADSPKLSFDQGTPTSRRIWTYSTWLKRSALGNLQASFLSFGDSDYFDLRFEDSSPNDRILIYISDAAATDLRTSRVFRDPSAWYHIVIASDTTDGTAGDRTRIYVNGVEETSFASETQPAQDFDYAGLESGDPIVIGNRYTGSHYFDGYLAETHFIDGQQLAPSSFGETDEDSGIWKPKKYSGSYGTNGFFLEFKNSAVGTGASDTIGADTSGNDNHFTSTNVATTDQTTDTPTNNWCTWNPLNAGATFTLAEGNCKNTALTDNHWIWANMYVNKGKWYYEIKQTNIGACGIKSLALADSQGANTNGTAGSVEFSSFHGTIYYDTSSDTTPSTSSNGDIIGCAFDMDNSKIYWHVNGTYIATTGGTQAPAAGTNPITFSNSTSEYYAPTFSAFSDNPNAEVNFGNPSFAISSGNADDNGYGNFEYDVPAGFYALCTKNLAEFG